MRLAEKTIESVGQIPRHLLHPLAVRLAVDASDFDSAGLQLDEEQNELTPEPSQAQHFHREQIARCNPIPVSLQKRLPRCALVTLRCRLDSVILKNPLHRVAADLLPNVGESAADPGVAPPGILLGHPDDKVRDLLGRSGATEHLALDCKTTALLVRETHPCCRAARAGSDSLLAGSRSDPAADDLAVRP